MGTVKIPHEDISWYRRVDPTYRVIMPTRRRGFGVLTHILGNLSNSITKEEIYRTGVIELTSVELEYT